MNKLLKLILISLAVLITGSAAVFYSVKNKQMPDLSISEVQIVNDRYFESSSYIVTIENKGDKSFRLDQIDADSSYGLNVGLVFAQDKIYPDSASLSKSDIRLIRVYKEKLEPGESISDTIVVSKPKVLDEGEYLWFTIYPDKAVKEINKQNNYAHTTIFSEGEKEVVRLRVKIPIGEYLKHFSYEFPREIYLGNPPEGKKYIVYGMSEDNYFLGNKLILLDNGSLLGPIMGLPFSYKRINKDKIWITAIHSGEYGGQTWFSLYVIDTNKHTLSEGYLLSECFGEDGWYNYQTVNSLMTPRFNTDIFGMMNLSKLIAHQG